MTLNVEEVVFRTRQIVTVRRKRSPRHLRNVRSLSRLFQEYQNQSRQNFAREVALLSVITLAGLAWPAIHTLQVLAQAM